MDDEILQAPTSPDLSGSSHGRPYVCCSCDCSYSYKRDLVRHVRMECGIDPQFHCPYCPKRFKRKYHLDRHIAHRHQNNNIARITGSCWLQQVRTCVGCYKRSPLSAVTALAPTPLRGPCVNMSAWSAGSSLNSIALTVRRGASGSIISLGILGIDIQI
ncbi:hypothetical protein J6590_002360 [Homalodisca vitripennis]|nr:hypothetical protein J6590_002360 [Homalodisca vitripennis]